MLQEGHRRNIPFAPKGTETFAFIEQTLRDALKAMGGDHPPRGGGPAANTNTYSYLKGHVSALAGLTDAQVWSSPSTTTSGSPRMVA